MFGIKPVIPSYCAIFSVAHYFPYVGRCHHDLARPQVADGRTACNKEGSCEYIEWAVADNWQGVILQLWGWPRC